MSSFSNLPVGSGSEMVVVSSSNSFTCWFFFSPLKCFANCEFTRERLGWFTIISAGTQAGAYAQFYSPAKDSLIIKNRTLGSQGFSVVLHSNK